VKISVPNLPKTTLAPGEPKPTTKVKIGLAGTKEKVALCRGLIKEITKFYHTEVTHPGIVHEELAIDKEYYNFIIGSKGSEIKNIQNSHKVQVHIPDATSVVQNVLVVGEPTAVANAKKHIEKLIERVNERKNPKPKVDEDGEEVVATPTVSTETAAATSEIEGTVSTPTAAAAVVTSPTKSATVSTTATTAASASAWPSAASANNTTTTVPAKEGEEAVWMKTLVPAGTIEGLTVPVTGVTFPAAPIGLAPPANKVDKNNAAGATTTANTGAAWKHLGKTW
jgi:hypothetical protein